ncbi:glycosyltransferase family 4 protein [Magnetospirillum molischianum]|uniref:Putative glycosyltransferase n=1 Tax=Magnetospirillum molischianum DSM 120 TaxID=1150626 RepID=H8FUS8_MAGML|nr:glycosyltransferase family 1 protein [Magnetospirillum molischianum]CCG42116.1 putative glycosyltransferase [Magnetospirillum molischianum DSM 120]
MKLTHQSPAQLNVVGTSSGNPLLNQQAGLVRLAAHVGMLLERGLVQRARARLRGPAHCRPEGPRQLLIDVSRIHQHDAGTGIQRVVRALLGQLHAVPPPGCVIRTVAGTRRRPYRYVDGPPGADDTIQVRPGDLFLGLDLSAHVIPSQRRQLAGWKRQGVSLHFVIYDLLAIHHPDWFSPKLAAAIRRWVRALAILADSAICISPVVRDDFDAWITGRYGLAAGEIATAVIPMGHDIQATAPSRGLPEGFENLCTILADRPTLLMVGTLEPRKGHAQVVAGFELLWSRGEEATLVIVGRPGWKTEPLQAHLRAHPERGRRLFWLDDASDEALARLYQACDGVIVASLGEGFGLPLIEALGYGKPVLARDLPVFRPHARPGLEFFQAQDPAALADYLVSWLERLTEEGEVAIETTVQIPSWQESSCALVDHLRQSVFLSPESFVEVVE